MMAQGDRDYARQTAMWCEENQDGGGRGAQPLEIQGVEVPWWKRDPCIPCVVPELCLKWTGKPCRGWIAIRIPFRDIDLPLIWDTGQKKLHSVFEFVDILLFILFFFAYPYRIPIGVAMLRWQVPKAKKLVTACKAEFVELQPSRTPLPPA